MQHNLYQAVQEFRILVQNEVETSYLKFINALFKIQKLAKDSPVVLQINQQFPLPLECNERNNPSQIYIGSIKAIILEAYLGHRSLSNSNTEIVFTLQTITVVDNEIRKIVYDPFSDTWLLRFETRYSTNKLLSRQPMLVKVT